MLKIETRDYLRNEEGKVSGGTRFMIWWCSLNLIIQTICMFTANDPMFHCLISIVYVVLLRLYLNIVWVYKVEEETDG